MAMECPTACSGLRHSRASEMGNNTLKYTLLSMPSNRIAKAERDLRCLSEASPFGTGEAPSFRASVPIREIPIDNDSLIKRYNTACLETSTDCDRHDHSRRNGLGILLRRRETH